MCECTRYRMCKSFSRTKPFMARWRSANTPRASGGEREEERVAAPSWVGQYCSSGYANTDQRIRSSEEVKLILWCIDFFIPCQWFNLLPRVYFSHWTWERTSQEAVPCPSFWMLMNSLSISHSTQASIAPLLVSSFDSFLLSHFMLAASSEHDAYNLTSCGVLATPPTMICEYRHEQLQSSWDRD